MAFPQSESNTSWLPTSKVAQEELDHNLAAELAAADENPFQESSEQITLKASTDKEEPEPLPDPSSSPAVNMINIVEETQRLNASTVPLVSDPRGDTWVFISPPSCQPGQDANQYKAVCDHYAIPHCMNSKTLINLNSPAFDFWWRSPAPQQRLLRRRQLVGRLPPNIKFVIDLTPHMEGDEGAHLLSELMCPYGIRTWVLAMSRWDISDYLVGGNEDFSCFDTQKHTETEEQGGVIDYTQPLLDDPSGALDPDEIRVVRRARSGFNENATLRKQEYIIPACYTATRHHCAIERVLNILVDNDPKLDSAPKVWTTFVIAKHLGVANHVNVNNYIIRWLHANTNPAFIDVLPELSLEIADGLQNEALCQEAFGILVGERALESIQPEATGLNESRSSHAPITLHGRRKYDISEAYETRLEYACITFREMVFGEYAKLVGGDWIADLPEFQRLSRVSYKNSAYQAAFHNLLRLLTGYIHGFVMFALRAKAAFISGPYGDRSEHNDIYPTTRFALIWEGLLLRQRLLTRSFWTLLGSMNLHTSISNNVMSEGATWGERTAQYDFYDRELDGESMIEKATTKTELEEALNDCKCKLVAARKIQKSQAWRIGENTADDVVASPGEDSFPNAWDQALDKIKSRYIYIGHPKALVDESDHHKAKRPKMEPLDDKTADPLQVVTPGTLLGLPLRQRVPPRPLANDPLWNQTSPAQSSQQLAPPPYDSSPFPTTPAQVPWAQVVDAEDVARRRVASRTDQNDIKQTTESQFWAQKSSMQVPITASASTADSKEWWEADSSIHNTYKDSKSRFFDLEIFLYEANERIHTVCARMLSSKSTKIENPDFGISNVLRCLTEKECKYLPLWAGGNDDGSGGVFDDEIPVPHAPFTTAGPKVFSSGNSSAASSSSEFDMISRVGSTKNTSTVVLDGFSDTLDRHRTYAASEISDHPSTVGKLASELGDFDMLSDVTADEYSDHIGAEAASEKGHKAQEAAQDEGDIRSNVDGQPSAVALGKARADPDESFDDVFNYDSDEEGTDSEGEDQVFEDD